MCTDPEAAKDTYPAGFLAHLYDTDIERDRLVGRYVAELHNHLWNVARACSPGASGYLADYLPSLPTDVRAAINDAVMAERERCLWLVRCVPAGDNVRNAIANAIREGLQP